MMVRTITLWLAAVVSGQASAQCPDAWSNAFGPGGVGMNGTVLALHVKDGRLHAGGNFFQAGTVRANYVAAWDGRSWTRLGTGGSFGGGGFSGPVYTLGEFNGELIAGGFFTWLGAAGGTTVNNLAAWDGSSWRSLGGGVTGAFRQVYATAIYQNSLIVAGSFASAGGAGGVPASNIAAWNGSQWSALGGGTDDFVQALAVYRGELIVGGQFAQVAGVTRRGLAVWNGSQWSSFPGGDAGFLGMVESLLVDGDDLYVGGNFSTLGSTPAQDIGRWNGSAWDPMGGGVLGVGVNAIMRRGDAIVIGGQFFEAGGVPVGNLASWNGSAWSAFAPPGTSIAVFAMTPYEDRLGTRPGLYIAGSFSEAGGVPANFISRFGPENPCPADFTCDGFLDFFDFADFVAAFEEGQEGADFNLDGFADFFDFADFVGAFEAGC